MRFRSGTRVRLYLLLLLLFDPWQSVAAVEPQRALTPQQAKGALGRTDPNDPQRPQQNNFYYYANGDRLSGGGTTSTKATTASFYDDRNFPLYYYTTQLSDLYWCLFVVLGWTVWMIHSLHSLRASSPAAGDDAPRPPLLSTPEECFPIFQQRYQSLLHVRGHVLEVLPVDTTGGTTTLVVDYVVERQSEEATELLQIRKYFATSTPAQVGFANIDLLVLPDDPMCAMLLQDYTAYQREEEGIQRVILEEQWRRRQRGKRRPDAVVDPIGTAPSLDPNTPKPLLSHQSRPGIVAGEETADAPPENNHDSNIFFEEDDDWCGCDTCRDWLDGSTLDAQQWKQLSLLLATLLVLASGFGCVQVVRRMDPHQRWRGWLTLGLGAVLLVPTAMAIYRLLRLCQRWSSAPSLEQQGFIVQSSSTAVSAREDATGVRLCTEALAEVCGAPSSATSTAFSYGVPALSGCYFIHYPKTTQDPAAPGEAAVPLAPQASSTSSISSLSEGEEGRWTSRADQSV